MEKILIDTDTVIDFLRGHHARIKDVFLKIERKEIRAYLTWINIVELYAGVKTEAQKASLEKLLMLFEILELEMKSSILAGGYRRRANIGVADSIIGALCVVNGLRLFTFNMKDFQKIKEINFYKITV